LFVLVVVLVVACVALVAASRFRPLEPGSISGAPGNADVELVSTPGGYEEIDVPFDAGTNVVVLSAIRNDGPVKVKVTGVDTGLSSGALAGIVEVRFIRDQSDRTQLGKQERFGSVTLDSDAEVTLALHVRQGGDCTPRSTLTFERVRVHYKVAGLSRAQWVDLVKPVVVVAPNRCP
jgi:hypothetical protein